MSQSVKVFECNVTSSWNSSNEKCIEDALSITTTSFTKSDDLESIVSLDSCVHLICPENSTPCTISMKFGKWNIKEMVIVSEARIIEVHGNLGEYLLTTQAEFFDQCEDMFVYIAEIKLQAPTPEITLKFPHLKNKDHLWLYGIHIIVENMPPPGVGTKPSVNFQNVNKILKDSSHQLTDKAEKCRKFLQSYSTPNADIMKKILESEFSVQYNQIGQQAKNFSKSLSDFVPGLCAETKTNYKFGCSSGDTSSDSQNNCKCLQMKDFMQQYINVHFTVLEDKIKLQIDEKFNELNKKQSEKLDLILNLLKDMRLTSYMNQLVRN